MCYDEAELLAYLDGELEPGERERIAAHLRDCPDCADRLSSLTEERAVAEEALSRLEPRGDLVAMPAAPAATAPAAAASAARPPRVMHWGRWVAAVAAVLVLASFAFAPVRSMAADFLQVFRVQRVQTVTVSEADMQQIAAAVKSGQGHIDLKQFGEAWVEGGGSKPETVTLAQAQAAVDFPVKLPAGESAEPTILLNRPQSVRFKLNVAAINQALKDYGATQTFPDSLDGKVFSVHVPAIVLARYPAPASTVQSGWPSRDFGIWVGQARSPELVVPEGVDASELRSVLLNLPLLPESVRSQLAAIDDWRSTLIIPNVDGSAHDTVIAGQQAVVISPKSKARDARAKLGPLPENTTVIWNDNGVVRAIGGPINEETAIGLAKSTMQ